jgi:hypothetical protein
MATPREMEMVARALGVTFEQYVALIYRTERIVMGLRQMGWSETGIAHALLDAPLDALEAILVGAGVYKTAQEPWIEALGRESDAN